VLNKIVMTKLHECVERELRMVVANIVVAGAADQEKISVEPIRVSDRCPPRRRAASLERNC
jgi:hypothetical protein